ncbi:MAG: glutamate-1-semialdehyde 2,1-aminomutase [Candidatus Omnitrophota bacterium]
MDAARVRKKDRYSESRRLFAQAGKYFPGGVNSPVRSFDYAGVEPVLFKKGKGSRVWDYDGNSYIDHVLCYGAAILGHAHPRVARGIEKAVKNGLGFGSTGSAEVALARLCKTAIPVLEKMRFVNSGTEAVMSAARLARGYTSRDKIVKFANSYHGHADHFLVKGGSALADMRLPLSEGVPSDFVKHTLVADYGDRAKIDRIFKRYGRKIAAVVVEPVGGNYGVVAPNKSFLRYVRKLTEKYGALLIFDEVITAFRFRYGSAADAFGVCPDLIALGKIIGGGLPIGAYGGREEVMNRLAPRGRVYQASTFGGNLAVMQAGIATLKTISSIKKRYGPLTRMTEGLTLAIREDAQRYGIALKAVCYGTMFSIKFREKKQFQRFYKMLLEEGVYFAPSEHEANFVSFAHGKKDIKETGKAVRNVFKKMRKQEKK